MTTTVIETALAGGGGLVKTLRHSYSLSDLRGDQHGPDEASGGSVYQPLEEDDGAVQRRTVRERSRADTEHELSLADKGEEYGAWSEERRSGAMRKTSW